MIFNLKKIFAKHQNLLIYAFGQFINVISPLIVVPYLVITCGEENLGKIGVGFSIALILIVLVDLGSYINGTKDIALNQENNAFIKETTVTIFLSKLIVFLFLLFILIPLFWFVPFFKEDFLQIILSLSIVLGQVFNPTWFFQGIQNFKWITTINVISKLIYVLGVLFFVKTPSDYVFVNLFWGLGLWLASVFSLFWIVKNYNLTLTDFKIKNSIQLLQSEFKLTVSQLFFSLYQYAPIIAVSYFLGNFMAGQYKIIDHIITVFRTYFQMFFNYIYAQVCVKVDENKQQGLQFWKKNNTFSYLGIVLILFVFFTFSKEILAFFKVQSKDIIGMQSILNIAFLVPLILGVSFALRQLMFAFHQNKAYINITIYVTILFFLILVLSLNIFSLKGVFFSIIFAEILVIVLYLFVLKIKKNDFFTHRF